MVGDEGTGRGAAGEALEDRRFELDPAALVHVVADLPDQLRPLGVGDELAAEEGAYPLRGVLGVTELGHADALHQVSVSIVTEYVGPASGDSRYCGYFALSARRAVADR